MSAPRILSLVGAVLWLTGCGAGSGETVPTASAPSGSLGVMTTEAATETVAALCELRDGTDREVANTTFFDRAHQPLHVLAAATERIDRVPAAGLLEAKQAVESDLRFDDLPTGFRRDVSALLAATRNALETVGLPAPSC